MQLRHFKLQSSHFQQLFQRNISMKGVILLAVFFSTYGLVTGFTLGAVRGACSRNIRMVSASVDHRFESLQLQPSVQSTNVKPIIDKPPTIANTALSHTKVVWDFTRPHTIIGSCISIVSLFLFAVPKSAWFTPIFRQSVLQALIPSLFVNLYITGLNQVTDVDIDRINKPYLPIAAGRLSKTNGILIVLASLFMGFYNFRSMDWPLQATLAGSALLGTLYSLPPFRLKRFPLLAAM